MVWRTNSELRWDLFFEVWDNKNLSFAFKEFFDFKRRGSHFVYFIIMFEKLYNEIVEHLLFRSY